MSRRKYSYEDYLRVKEQRDKGLRFQEIAPIVGISKSMCSVVMRYGKNLPRSIPVHFSESIKQVVSNETGEVLFQHDPYYKF